MNEEVGKMYTEGGLAMGKRQRKKGVKRWILDGRKSL